MKATLIPVCALISLAALGGCGSRSIVTVQDSTSITKGVELTDLQRALQEGAINQQEYETRRKAVMRRPN